MTRGLLASALLRSLQHTRFQIATDNCFVYSQGVADSKTDETCAGELRFLMDKIKNDARHEIIPHVLGTHILSLLLQGGPSPAHLTKAERVVAIFSPDLQPLLRATCTRSCSTPRRARGTCPRRRASSCSTCCARDAALRVN